jgi:hypothetical protein
MNLVDISEKSWNQIEEYIWKWYPILIGVASIEEEKKKPLSHDSIGTK